LKLRKPKFFAAILSALMMCMGAFYMDVDASELENIAVNATWQHDEMDKDIRIIVRLRNKITEPYSQRRC